MSVLCMGWSWSPIISQAISWLIVLFRLPGEPSLLPANATDSWSVSEAPPPMLQLEDGGVISILYDNFLIVTTNAKLRDDLTSRIVRNLKHFNVAKYLKTETNHFSYNGIEASRDRSGLQWRINEDTFKNWIESFESCDTQNSLDFRHSISGRDIAALQQTLVCHANTQRTSLRPLARIFAQTSKIFGFLSQKPRKVWSPEGMLERHNQRPH